MSPFRTAPLTTECLIICTALLVICNARTWEDTSFTDAQRQWGAVVLLPSEEGLDANHQQLRGPLDVWQGEWWRIFLSAFHHINAIHLLLNCAATWILGTRLERRWGSVRYTLFLLPAIGIPLLAESLAGNIAMGFSGVACAMLGALIVCQRLDPTENDLPDEAIHVAMGLILFGIPATALDILHVANVSHFVGLAYGSSAVWAMCGPSSRFMIVRGGFVTAHLLMIPAVWLAVHPVLDGRYLWYLADRDSNTPQQRESLLKLAVDSNPSLIAAWLRLANDRAADKGLQAAWSVILEGLSKNPTDADLFEEARRIWRRLPHGQERDLAEAELRRVFGDQASAWAKQIRSAGLAMNNSPPPISEPPLLDPKDFPLDQPIDLQWQPKPVENHLPQPFDPNQPESAAEGKAI